MMHLAPAHPASPPGARPSDSRPHKVIIVPARRARRGSPPARAGGAHVVEPPAAVGGRCSAIEANGFRFDLGPTFFLSIPVLERIFQP